MAIDLDETWAQLARLCASHPAANELVARGRIRAYRIGSGAQRMFAFLATEPEARGIHVRSNDPAVRESPRFEESRIFLQSGRSNWVRLMWTDQPIDWGEVKQLVKASYDLALRNDLGMTSSHGGLYPILAKALTVAVPAEQPPPPYQAGGPMPKLPAPLALGIAIWSADHVKAFARPEEKEERDRIVALAKEALEHAPEQLTKASLEPRIKALQAPLTAAAKSKSRDSRAMGAARRTAGAAASLCWNKPDMVWTNAALAAERAVQALQGRRDPAIVRAYIVALDDRILLDELSGIDEEFDAKRKASKGVARVLWRGTNEKGLPSAWLVRLGKGSYGLRHKAGTRFVWVTGSRDDVIASVPDAAFEGAAKIAIDRDVDGDG